MSFVEVFTENDPELLEQDVYEQIQAQFEEWEPAAGNLETWLTKAFVRIASSVWDLASVVSREAFKTFGETIVNVPPILAAPATVNSTWTMVDDAGYTIPDGTLVAIAATGDERIGFRTVGTVVVAPGSTATAAGAVTLEAVEPGVGGNGLSTSPTLIDGLAFVESIALVGATSGGVDAEDEDAYLERLVQELQTLTMSAVIPRDYEILSRRVAGVARATALDNYDADTEEEGVPLVISVAVVDANGAALSEGVKAEVKALLEERSLTNVLTYVIDPTYTSVDVKAEVVALPGYDPEAVAAAVQARLEGYLSPGNWGLPREGDKSSSSGWVNQTTVYRNELISEADRVAGVERVADLKLVKSGGGLGTADVELTGPAALAEPGTIEALAV